MIRKSELEGLISLSVRTIENSIEQLERLCAPEDAGQSFDQTTISEAVKLSSLARAIENAADSIGMAGVSELRDFLPEETKACKKMRNGLSSSVPDSGGHVA